LGMNRFMFWQKWLAAVSLIVAIFGTALAWLGSTALFDAFSDQVNHAFWSNTGISAEARALEQWLFGVLGPTMAGWGIFLLYIVRHPFKGGKLGLGTA
jgi:hypothetical protein